jgi:hypothetical protein
VVPDSFTWTPTAVARERTVIPAWIGVEILMSWSPCTTRGRASSGATALAAS